MDDNFDDLFMEMEGGEKPEEFPNLPAELQGKDLTPDETEKLKNDFPTLRDYITISFNREQEQELADLLGVSVLNTKIKNTYTLDELKGMRKYGLL